MYIPRNDHFLAQLARSVSTMKPDASVRITVADVLAVAKTARKAELKLREENIARRQAEHEVKNVQGKLEFELARLTNMIEAPSITFIDPQPTEPLPLVIYRHQTGFKTAWRRFWEILRGKETPQVWACHRCGKTHVTREWAVRCCALKGTHPCECGATITSDFYTKCESCIERGKLLKAERLAPEGYTGWIHSDHVAGYNDGFFEHIECMEEWCAGEGIEVPPYVWACDEHCWSGLDAYGEIESDMDNHHDDAIDHVVDMDELLTFVDAWNKKQNITSYYPDETRVIVLDPVRFAAMVGEAQRSTIIANTDDAEDDHRVA